jgi:hypothetical protein
MKATDHPAPSPAAATPALVLAAVLGAALAGLPAPAALACSCRSLLNVEHPCQIYSERAVVFLGRAVAEPVVRPYHDESGGERTFRFAVEEAFAGVDGPTVEIVTGMGGGDCGVDFEVGRLTFVHAWRSQRGDEIVSWLCGTRTTRNLHSPDVDYARARKAGAVGPAIFGRVARGTAEEYPPPGEDDGLPGATVTARGPGGEALTATTDAKGWFEVPGPLAGAWAVRAEVPEGGVRLVLPEQTVEVRPGGCAGVEFLAEAPASDEPGSP